MRPEKIWLTDLTPDMVQTDGTSRPPSYDGATTPYLFEIAPGVQLIGAGAEPALGAYRGALGRR